VAAQTSTQPDPEERAPLLLRRLLPAAAPATAAEIVQDLGLWERPSGPPPARPRMLLNMVSTADGHATLGGRSGPLSGPADRELFHALRAPVDAVLMGAGTVRAEHYGRLIGAEPTRRLRRERGLPEEPLACIVSASLDLDPATPLLADPDARLLVLTPSAGELPPTAAEVAYVRAERAGVLDLSAALAQLSERFDVRVLLCEGGPHLAGELLAAGLLDELFLSLSPLLTGAAPGGAEGLRITAGAELAPPAQLELLGALECDSHVFLRYGVVAPERVSRETMLSSSLAR
jgi:riboflavin biosynthesis pyrimidine reductase